MKWFALVDADWNIIGNDITNGKPPAVPANVLAVESQFAAPNPQRHAVDLSSGAPVIVERVPSINEIKKKLGKRIDSYASQIRSAYITTTPGQDIVYAQKEAEAMAALEQIAAGQQQSELNYPFLAAEMDVTGKTLAEVAQQIMAVAQQWKAIGAQIERARRAGKLAVEAATDKAGVQQALDAAISELNGLLPGNTE